MGSLLSTENEQGNEGANQAAVFSEERIMEQSLQPKRLRNPQVTILVEILRVKAKLNEDLVKENNAILKEFLDTFIPEMRKHDKIFDLLFQRIYYTGSYYSDLRVSVPDEYDLNLILKFPFKPGTVAIEYQNQVPSYMKFKVNDPNNIPKENGLVKLFENGFLMPDNVRKWIQSVVDRALKTYKPRGRVIEVKSSAAGPARTIILKKRVGIIDVDLVPVVECCLGLKPPKIDGRVHEKVKNNLGCFLVPKPYMPAGQPPVNAAERSRLWRAHYPQAEQELLHDFGCVKLVIKLLKLLRDKENWKSIASYYLKTIVLWMVIEDPVKENWKQDHLGEKFMKALCVLQACVEGKRIRYFFSSSYNLLEKLSEAEAANIQYRLRGIIKDIEKDNDNLWNIFGCQKTFHLVSKS